MKIKCGPSSHSVPNSFGVFHCAILMKKGSFENNNKQKKRNINWEEKEKSEQRFFEPRRSKLLRSFPLRDFDEKGRI